MTDFILKSAASMAALLLLYYALLQNQKMHRFNRFYLLGALVFSIALPFISIPVYVAVKAPIAIAINTATAIHIPAVGNNSILSPKINYMPYVLWGIYSLVTLLLMFRFIYNLWQFKKQVVQHERQQYKDAMLVLVNDAIVPHTFLNYIFINKDEYQNRSIEPELFTHELAHVTQRHTLDILFIEVLKTLMWFNPLLYLYKRAIQLNHEFLADENVLTQTNNVITYQQLLLQRATPHTSYALASSLNFGTTKKRFTMMTKTTQKNKALLLKLAALPVLAGLVYSLSIETVAQQVPSDKAVANVSLNDSAAYKKKRDAYYSNVKVVIDDQANNVYINKPYEQLTEGQKSRYYFTLPEAREMKFIPETEYKKLQNKKGYRVEVDGIQIDNTDLLKRSSKEFVYYFFLTRAKKSLTKERPQIFEYFLYTAPYYNTHFKNQEPTHYPDSIFKVSIIKEYKNDKVVAAAKPKKFHNVKAAMDYLGGKGAINYTNVDKMPQYPGGLEKFSTLVTSNYKAPQTANPDITTYYLNFVIETDGEMSYATVINAEDEGTTREIIRILKTSENWKPGELNGKPVRTSYTLPIHLK